MKFTQRILPWLGVLALAGMNPQFSTGFAQGTAFTYQGRLNVSSAPANGSYDLTFGVFTDSNGFSQVGATLTNSATPISNGLFTVTLDFGSGIFTGSPLWLQIGAQTNGGGSFTLLAPLQPLTATPYAVYAMTPAGPQGVQGPVGPMGPQGVPGANGTNLVSLLGVLTNGSPLAASNLVGTLPSSLPNTAPMVLTNVFWGDSLMAGTGGLGGWPISTYMQTATGIPSINEANGGWTSTQILTNFLTNVLLHPELTNTNHFHFIWSGRNDFSYLAQVESDIATMVSYLPANHYQIWSVLNATNEGIGTAYYTNIVLELNPALAAIYGTNYIDVRKFLVNSANLKLASDQWSYANDVPAASLHSPGDAIHLNNAGYVDVVDLILQSWFPGGNNAIPTYGEILSTVQNALVSPPPIGSAQPSYGNFTSLEISSGRNQVQLYISGDGSGVELGGNASFNSGDFGTLGGWGSIDCQSVYVGKFGFATAGDGSLDLFTPANAVFETSAGVKLGQPSEYWGAVYAGPYYGDGSGLTNIPAPQLVGTLPQSTFPSNVSLSGVFAGDGSGLTALNASQITKGTMGLGQLPSAVVTNGASGMTLSGTFSGNGSGLSGLVGSGNYVLSYSSVTQAVVTVNTFQNITNNTDTQINGWTHTAGTAAYTCAQSGLYVVQYTAVALTTATATTTVSLHAVDNGTEIPDSQCSAVANTANQTVPISKSFIASFNLGDVLQFQLAGSSTDDRIVSNYGLGTTRPSFSCTIIRIQ